MSSSLKHQIKITIVLVLFHIFIYAIFGFFEQINTKEIIKEILSFMIVNSVILSVVFLIPGIQFRNIILFISSALLIVLSFIKFSFLHLYDSKITDSAWFIIFETNTEEIIEYFQNYFTGKIALLSVVYSIMIILFFRIFVFQRKTWLKELKTKLYTKLILVLVVSSYFFQSPQRFLNYDILYGFCNSIEGYHLYREQLKNTLSNNYLPQGEADSMCSNDTLPTVHVVVVGESLTNHHMSLYGYPRKTNPKLENIKEELLIFKNVVSPHAYTIESLSKVLTMASTANPSPKNNFSIIQLANEINFETYWISNQKPVGIWENLTTITATASKNKYWLQTKDFKTRIEDESVLPVLAKVLEEPAENKVIFVHLMGVHGAYEKRYPKTYNYFNDKPPILFLETDEAVNMINEYDNAVRYNDYILHSVISMVKTKNKSSTVTYFSDHGEEVYEEIDFIGHNEDIGSSAMFDVPLLFWFSEKYIDQNQLKIEALRRHEYRKYNLEDFPHTFADILKIRSNKLNNKKSILNPN